MATNSIKDLFDDKVDPSKIDPEHYNNDRTFRVMYIYDIKNNNVILNPNKAQVMLIQGARGSGKSTTDEKFGELLYNEGHTIIDLLSAPNLENCYWAVCKNCKQEWQDKDKNARKELHCKCHNRHKILLVVPEYVEFDDYL